MSQTVGVIGLGSLGLAIAARLIERGHTVVGFRRSAMTEFIAAGGVAATSAEDVGRHCDTVLTLLPSAEAIDDAYCGPRGLLNAGRPGMTAIDLSTVPLRAKQVLLEKASKAGIGMLEGTVSGNPVYISSSEAAVFIGGERPLFDRHASLLRDITNQVTWVGPFGSGRVAKFVALYLVAVHTLAAAEALELASQTGLDLPSIYQAIKGSNATSAMFESRGAFMIQRDYSGYNTDMHGTARATGDAPPRGFASRTRQIKRLAGLARALGGRYPLMEAMNETYQNALEQKFGTYDIVEVFEYLMAATTDCPDEQRLLGLIDEFS